MAAALVGGAFLSAFLNVLFDKLASRKLFDFFQKQKLDLELLKKLKRALRSVNAVLEDAEAQQDTKPEVKEWLEELRDVIYHAEDILDEISTEASRFNIENGSKHDKFDLCKIEKIIDTLDDIASQKEFLRLKEGVGGSLSSRWESTSVVDESLVCGRSKEKSQILELLLADVNTSTSGGSGGGGGNGGGGSGSGSSSSGSGNGNGEILSVITIVGMGGIGKTTLAQLLYNDIKVQKYFELKAWVCVTEELDVGKVTRTILESVTSKPSAITNLNSLQVELKKVLARKRFLIVLDDVWNENYCNWDFLRAPFTTAAIGSKIIVTTRSKIVASVMTTGNNLICNLQKLSDEDSLLLFTNHALGGGRNFDAFPDLKLIGEKIVRKCQGLPLASKTLGGALRSTRDPGAWENILNSKMWDLQITNNILPALRLSYHHLPAQLKRCFAYCSIFPKNHEFEKNHLVLLWMAEGFVQSTESDKSMEELGADYFHELLARSFIEKSSDGFGFGFVMHDLINDLAQYASGKFSLRMERSKVCHEVSEKVRHLSYYQGWHDSYDKFKPLEEIKYLRTFVPGSNYCSSKVICDLLPNFSCLRVLSCSFYSNFVEVPDSIGNLSHLRLLDFSHTAIKKLPDTICQLYNLQSLLLSYCRSLIKLPENMGELVNLRHLDIRETGLREMPLQMGRLASLRTLSDFVVGKQIGSGLRELKELGHLEGSLSIRNLQNVKNATDAMEANLKNKKGLKNLVLEWDSDTEDSSSEREVLENLQPCTNLISLTLEYYGGTSFPNWLMNHFLSKLTYLQLSECRHCLFLPPLGQLPSLRKLYITGNSILTKVDVTFYGIGPSSIKPFQKLTILMFSQMLEWEEWSTSGVDSDDFPNLEELSILDCPKLREKLPNHLPLLQKLVIKNCHQLNASIPGDAPLRSPELYGCRVVIPGSTAHFRSSLQIAKLSNEQFDIPNSFLENMMNSCSILQELTIAHWSSLMHFPTGLPTTLRILNISYCKRLEFPSENMLHNFNFLESLCLMSSCDSMRSFPLGFFPRLKILLIEGCMNLESFSIPDPHRENLKSLQNFVLRSCHKLLSFPSGGFPAPNLAYFEVNDCQNLISLPESMNTLFTSLIEFMVVDCPELESLPEGGLSYSMQNLWIENCNKLMATRLEWGLEKLMFLKTLYILRYKELEAFPGEWILPTSINHISIKACPNLKHLDTMKLLYLNSLQSLNIQQCPKLCFLPEQELPASLSLLIIKECPLMEQQLLREKVHSRTCLQIDNEVIF